MTTTIPETPVVNWNPVPLTGGPTTYPQGPPGSTGPQGQKGDRGSYWWQGSGPPIGTSDPFKPNDMYLDTLTGDVYVLS